VMSTFAHFDGAVYGNQASPRTSSPSHVPARDAHAFIKACCTSSCALWWRPTVCECPSVPARPSRDGASTGANPRGTVTGAHFMHTHTSVLHWALATRCMLVCMHAMVRGTQSMHTHGCGGALACRAMRACVVLLPLHGMATARCMCTLTPECALCICVESGRSTLTPGCEVGRR
jgi:hypothetical protein